MVRGTTAVWCVMGALACTGPGELDAKPSEYFPLGGESKCDPAGAPQAASKQGHVANWWKCLDTSSGSPKPSMELRVWNVFSGHLVGAVSLPPSEPAWLPAYASDGWLVVVNSAGGLEPSVQVTTPGGEPWWRVTLPANPSTNPSVTADDDIVVGDAAGQLHAFSKNGRSLWAAPLGGPAINRVGIARDGSLVAAVKKDARYELVSIAWGGAIRWRVPADVAVSSPIITKDDRVVLTTYLGNADDLPADATKYRMRAYGLADGALAWEVTLNGQPFGPVEGPDGTVYVADESGGGVTAFHGRDGTVRWKASVTPDGAAPTVLDNGWLTVGCGTGLCVLNAATGALVGTMPAGTSGVVHGAFAQGGILSAPTISGHYYVWNIGGGVNTARGCWSRLGGDDAFTGRAQ